MSSFNYQNSTITKYRAGTSSDPYIDITESKKVINGVIQLNEIPVSLNKVRITGYYELPVSNTTSLGTNEYRVDYAEGLVYFNSAAEGLTLTAVYKGRGNHYVSSGRIWVEESEGNVVQTLKDIIVAGQEVIDELPTLNQTIDDAHEATADANTAAANADAKAALAVTATTNANTATSNANAATGLANIATSQANAARDDANTAASAANTSAANANNKAEFAQTQGDYAKSQGDAAGIVIEDSNDFIDNTRYIAPYSTATTYEKNNIVSFNGNSYIAKRPTLNNTPTDEPGDLNWGLMSRRGDDGTGTVHIHRDVFISTEAQTVFTLSHTYDQFQNRTEVYVSGVPQKTPENYQETNSNTITLSEELPAGLSVEIKYFSQSVPLESDIQTVVDNHTGQISSINGEIDNVTAQLAETENKIKGSVNIYEYAYLKVGNDWTAAISAAITAAPYGGELIFPEGIYEHTEIVINRSINVRGCGKYATRLKNVGVGTTAITISANVEKGTFKDISIWGNGTTNFGTDATSGKGIQFNSNTTCWNIDNVWMRGHGDWYLYADGNGNVNNINLTNSELEYGKKGAIHLIQSSTSNQINAVNIINCNFSGFADNIMELWGQSITVANCAIQATKAKGIVIDGNISPVAQTSARAIRIENNYFELCNYGFIFGRAIVSPFVRYLFSLSIKGNYGTYGVISGDTVSTSSVSLVEIQAPGFYDYDNFQCSGLVYQANDFNRNTAGFIFNGNDVLAPNCTVQRSASSVSEINYYTKLGRAKVEDNHGDAYVVKGISNCVNNTYTIDKSANITTTTDLIFDIRNYSKGNLIGIDIPTSTDATNYSVSVLKKYRPAGATTSYVDEVLHNWSGQSGSNLLVKTFTTNGKSNVYEDFYIVIHITFNGGNTMTNFYVGNPILRLNN